MSTSHRTQPSRGRVALGAVFSFALIAAACSNKKDDSTKTVNATSAPVATTAATVAATTTIAGAAATNAPATNAAATNAPATAAPTTAAVEKPVTGGKLIVSGESLVASPWTPAKMQCSEYCQTRARAFFDPVTAVGTDGKVHPYLAESVNPNADFTVWTVKLRSGIKFTDDTPVNADAVIKNLQAAGQGILVSGALTDVAKNPDKSLKIVKKDDLTFDIYTGKGGDPAKPVTWVDFSRYLSGQWGLIASPAWLDAAKADPTKETTPIGSGPFILTSYSDDLTVVKRNPNYWQKDANGTQLPYLDEIDFRVIPDSANAEKALQAGDIDIFATSDANVVKDFRDKAAQFPMKELSKFTESEFMLIDVSKKDALSDRRVRCALSAAMDRKELIDAWQGGISAPGNGPFSPGQQGYLDDNGLKTEQNLAEAKALIDDYKKSTGSATVKVSLGISAPSTNNETLAELLKGYWSQIGVDTTVQQVEESKFITNALFGIPDFQMYKWRQHAGLSVDEQYYWWHSAGSHPDGSLSLNFARLNDPVIDKNLDIARSATDPAAAEAAAEEINKQFAKECYYIPISHTVWGIPHKSSIQGLDQSITPDGSPVEDGAGFPGQFWLSNLWIKK
jgi:peptide/nickel transport system substrate-binding protein